MLKRLISLLLIFTTLFNTVYLSVYTSYPDPAIISDILIANNIRNYLESQKETTLSQIKEHLSSISNGQISNSVHTLDMKNTSVIGVNEDVTYIIKFLKEKTKQTENIFKQIMMQKQMDTTQIRHKKSTTTKYLINAMNKVTNNKRIPFKSAYEQFKEAGVIRAG